MKKLLFSVVAIIAFSVNSFSSNEIDTYFYNQDSSISVENFNLEHSVDFEELQNCRDCFAEATAAEARVLGLDPGADGFAVFENTYNQCEASGNCCNCLRGITLTP
ncbi:MAG: hypothetical protein ACK4FS_11265 [Flavobacterium sp.]